MQVVHVPNKWRWLVLSVDQPTILMRAVACYFTLGGCLDGRLLAIARHHSCVSTRSLQARFCSRLPTGGVKKGKRKRKQNVSIWFCPKIIKGVEFMCVMPECIDSVKKRKIIRNVPWVYTRHYIHEPKYFFFIRIKKNTNN